MILADVVGRVVVTRRTPAPVDPVFLYVREVEDGEWFVALDSLGAREGERVLVSRGPSARQTEDTRDNPVDALIVGIVELVEKEGEMVYDKSL